MLDAEHATITKVGSVTITTDGIVVSGFEADNATCRDIAALSATWAIGRLQQELMRTLERPGDNNINVE